MAARTRIAAALLLLACAGLAGAQEGTSGAPGGAVPNHPYPASERGSDTLYASFIQRPKHLDPAISYSSDEYAIIDLVVEPPLDYHYLKRPYELMPVTVEDVPAPEYFDAEGNRLQGDPPADRVARAVYTLHVRPGIRYAPHPCFARGEHGTYAYHSFRFDPPWVDRVLDALAGSTRGWTDAGTPADVMDQIDLALSLVPEGPWPSEEASALEALRQDIRLHRHWFTSRDAWEPHVRFVFAGVETEIQSRMIEAVLAALDVDDISDFPLRETRELTAADFVYQIRRLADPTLSRTCPILETLAQYIDGLGEFADALRTDLERIRAERKAAQGILYSKEVDERAHPILLDYDEHPLPGVELVDERTFRIILDRKYPQIRYWLAMPFFAPTPWEAVRFYRQEPMIRRNLMMDRYPVGTGPYFMTRMDENLEIVLERNPNYRHVPYPSEGSDEARASGLLEDAGRSIPFIQRIVRRREKEAMPRWQKFLQGYYDMSTIQEDVFSQAIRVGGGQQALTESMRARGIGLSVEVLPSTWYYGFNMLDPVVGGFTPDRRKLRQAFSIALDTEEYIQIFANGRGVAGHSPIPPGIFGSLDGDRQFNPFVYDYDEAAGRPVRKSLDEARRLLAEAGYPNGQDARGRPLVIHYDNSLDQAGLEDELRWVVSRFAKIGVTLVCRTTDYNRFQEKVRSGDFQMFSWGWNADYPDPENFLFMLYGPNAKTRSGGENAANYENPEFDALFRRMESMTDGPERAEIIGRMLRIVQEDAPWSVREHPVDYILAHEWVRNHAANPMARGIQKYYRIDPALRERRRAGWNSPIWWPVGALVLGIAALAAPGFLVARRRALARGRDA